MSEIRNVLYQKLAALAFFRARKILVQTHNVDRYLEQYRQALNLEKKATP